MSWRWRGIVTVLLASAVSLLAMPACGETGAERMETASTSARGTSDTRDPDATGGVFFPRWRGPVPGVGDNGRLFEDEAGCVRVRISENFEEAGENLTVLWPKPWSAVRGQGGRVRILNERGRVLARDGDEVFLGGYSSLGRPLEEASSGVDERTKEELRRRCPGGYYFVGSMGPPRVIREESTASR